MENITKREREEEEEEKELKRLKKEEKEALKRKRKAENKVEKLGKKLKKLKTKEEEEEEKWITILNFFKNNSEIILKLCKENTKLQLAICQSKFVPHEWFSCLPSPIQVCGGIGGPEGAERAETIEMSVMEAITKGLFAFFDLLDRMCKLGMTSQYVPTKEQKTNKISYLTENNDKIDIEWTNLFKPWKKYFITSEILWENYKYLKKQGQVSEKSLEDLKKILKEKYNFVPSATPKIIPFVKKPNTFSFHKKPSFQFSVPHVRKEDIPIAPTYITGIVIRIINKNEKVDIPPLIIPKEYYCEEINRFYNLLKDNEILPFKFE